MNISAKDLNKEELLLFLNESALCVLIEAGGKFRAANRFFYEMTGYSNEELKNRSVESLFTEESRYRLRACKQRIAESIEKSQVIRAEDKQLPAVIIDNSGKQIGVVAVLVRLSTGNEEKWGYKLVDHSLFHTETKHIEKMEKLKDYLLNISQSLIQLKDIQNFYALVLEAAGKTISQGEYCTILRLEEGDTFVPVASRGYPWTVMEKFRLPVTESFSWLLLGRMLDRTLIVDDIDALCEKTNNLIGIEGFSIKSSLQTPIFLNDELYGILTIDSSRKNVFTEDDFNTIEYLRAQIQIALENQLLYNKMQHQASHDELTDVASRGAFEEQVIKFLHTKHHYESCCIIMMDLNDLKIVNDVWGHAAGDRILLEFIRVMQKNMRGSDLLARLGGDEFAICFFSSQSAQFIERIEEIQQYFIDNPLDFDGTKVSCYFSYGISHCPEDGESYAVLLNTADSRMYSMKANLKGRELTNDLYRFRK